MTVPWRDQLRAVALLVCLLPFWILLLTLTAGLMVVVVVTERVDGWLLRRRVRRFLALLAKETRS